LAVGSYRTSVAGK